jgi:hypothetical protein
MLAQQIHDWIAQRGPYAQGLQLASKAGAKIPADLQNVQVVFPQMRERLTQLLRPYAAPSTAKDVAHAVAHVSGETEPEAVASLRLQLRDVYKVYGALKGQLYAACLDGQDGTRYDIARQIMEEVIPRINDMSAKLKSHERSGILPAFSDREIVRLTVEKMKQLGNLESRVSRLKGWIKTGTAFGEKLTPDKLAEYEKEQRDKEARIQELKEELDA